jgi:RNA polymerase sigma factor (sigma-70 family)
MLQNDASLVAQVLGGDPSAFGPLIDRHRPTAMRLARRLLGHPADAEDVVQEALLQAFLGLHELRLTDRFGAWLLGIVVNLCRMRWRGRPGVYAIEDWEGGRVVPGVTWVDRQPSPDVIAEAQELHRLVLDAIALLPAEQQQAVRLHYLEGLTLWDIAGLAGVPVGTVKARLHRARARLRQHVGRAVADTSEPIPSITEEVSMIAVIVHDLIVRAPTDAAGQWPAPHEYKHVGEQSRRQWEREIHRRRLAPMCVVLLKEQAGERILPMWIGLSEGLALMLHLRATTTPRPMTYDLTARLLEVAEARIEQVTVTSLRDNTFYATLRVRVGDRVHDVDARPSDALNVALRVNAPIFVAPEVFEQGFMLTVEGALTTLEEKLRKDIEAERVPPETVPMAYLSFRSLPRGS